MIGATSWVAMIPDLETAVVAGGLGLAWGGGLALFVARLRRRGVRVPYTRKIFHFGIFTAAAGIHAGWGLAGTNSFGAAIAALVVISVFVGEGNGLFDALARETDRPHGALFIMVPLVTTAVGGLVAALWTGPYAAVGYLVAGWGDAVGEPVGARFGRHPYRVPSLAGVPAIRTLEGSAAVFLLGWGAAALALGYLGVGGPTLVLTGLACAGVGAAVEAISNHGLDNLTVQLAASGCAWALLS
jgi:phytol kinase